jgi:hypothetical protein
VFKQGRYDRALGQFEADCDGTAVETLAQLASPGVDDRGAMLDDGLFEGVSASDLQTNIVLAVCPVDADERCEFDTCSCMETSWL